MRRACGGARLCVAACVGHQHGRFVLRRDGTRRRVRTDGRVGWWMSGLSSSAGPPVSNQRVPCVDPTLRRPLQQPPERWRLAEGRRSRCVAEHICEQWHPLAAREDGCRLPPALELAGPTSPSPSRRPLSVSLHDFVARRAPLVPARLSVHSALESAPRTIPSRARRHHASPLTPTHAPSFVYRRTTVRAQERHGHQARCAKRESPGTQLAARARSRRCLECLSPGLTLL